jgi:adenosine/AMP kinase
VKSRSHFIKTVEDLHEALVGAVPGIRFGLGALVAPTYLRYLNAR